MKDTQKLILKALLDLPKSERDEVIKEAQSFETKTFSQKSEINESLLKTKRFLGSVGGTPCPVCGRS